MKNKTTLYHFILDSSGSMQSVREKTIHLFNEQLSVIKNISIKNPEKRLLTSLTVFNQDVKHVLNEIAAHKLTDLSINSYSPEGFTALYDAIGESISRVEEIHQSKIEADEMTVVFLILTDGHENASRTYDIRQVSEKIKALETTEKWLFTILGADFDITDVSSSLHIQNAYNYQKSNFMGMSRDLRDSLSSYEESKSMGFMKTSFFEPTQKKNEKEK